MIALRKGFTLLEVMVAVAIVAVSMGVIVEIESHAIEKTNDAKAFTVATLLARGKILDVQQKLQEDGFGDFMKILDGDFEEEGFPDFRWVARVRKVEVPTPPTGSGVEGAATGATGNAAPGMSLAMLGPMFQNVGQVLENAVREIDLRVMWKDGVYDRDIRIVTHVIDKQGLASGLQNSGLSGMSNLSNLVSGASGSAGGGARSGATGGTTRGRTASPAAPSRGAISGSRLSK